MIRDETGSKNEIKIYSGAGNSGEGRDLVCLWLYTVYDLNFFGKLR